MNVSGFPKGSGTLTTAYEEQTGYVYVYFTTDSTNGSIYLLKDKAGLTSPGEGSGLLYQQSEVYGNGSGTVLADKMEICMSGMNPDGCMPSNLPPCIWKMLSFQTECRH